MVCTGRCFQYTIEGLRNVNQRCCQLPRRDCLYMYPSVGVARGEITSALCRHHTQNGDPICCPPPPSIPLSLPFSTPVPPEVVLALSSHYYTSSKVKEWERKYDVCNKWNVSNWYNKNKWTNSWCRTTLWRGFEITIGQLLYWTGSTSEKKVVCRRPAWCPVPAQLQHFDVTWKKLRCLQLQRNRKCPKVQFSS